MKRLVFSFCILFAGLLFCRGADELKPVALDPIFQQAEPWDTTIGDFAVENKDAGFRWLSTTHDAAQSARPKLSLFDIPLNQIIVRFSNGKLGEVSALFYNRGDAGEMQRDKFEALEQQCEKAITDFTKAVPVERGKDPTNAVKAQGWIWQTDKSQFLLEFSFTRTPAIPYRAEFIRLTVTPREKPKSLLEESQMSSQPTGKFNGLAHLVKDPGGDVRIDGIPMVDQGQKGYCVVASAERVMRYYGIRVDENELAQIANTSADKGTSYAVMFDALRKLCNRLRVKTRSVMDFDVTRFDQMIADYNRAAKNGQRAQEINPYIAKNFGDLIKQMNPEVLREVRTKNPADMDRFYRLAQQHIDEGIPLLWSVMIGVLPEAGDPTKGTGGHMRLIIGYNQSSKEVLYSDSWGIGHELKRMPLSDAWTITTGLNSIEPL